MRAPLSWSVLILLALASWLPAEPIIYVFDGVGSGTLDGQSFADQPFTIVHSADTIDICECIGPDVFSVAGTTIIGIMGFPQATFSNPVRVFSNLNNEAVGLLEAIDMVDLQDPAFAGYVLDGPLGPIFEPDPFAVNQFVNIETTQGLLTFDDIESVTFEAILGGPAPEFIRGDADGNGTFTGLVDGLFLLNYQFVPGSPAPPCLEAADADDDGSVTGLVDGFYLLSFQFVAGSPPPPPPYPSCGVGVTPSLSCDESSCP